MNVDDLVNRITTLMQSQFGLKPKNQIGTHQRLYPAWYDIVQLPSCYQVPDFSKFTGVDEMTTLEHVSSYLAQFGEASMEEAHRVRFFPLSLSRPAFK